MTKTARHKALNDEFFTWCNETFPGCVIDDSEGYGRVYIYPKLGLHGIEYHLSRHDVISMSWGNDDECHYINGVVDRMELKLEELCRKYDL